MTVSSVFAAIYGIIKAVPILEGWVQQFLEYFVNKKVLEIENYHTGKSAKITVVLFNIKKAKTHAEKRILMSLLADIERL